MPQTASSSILYSTVHDVVIVGSGAAGGMAAWNLSRKGINVLVLDAGEKFSRSKFWTHVTPWEWRERMDRGERPIQFELDKKEQPYVTPKDDPFDLVRLIHEHLRRHVHGHRAEPERHLEPHQALGEVDRADNDLRGHRYGACL